MPIPDLSKYSFEKLKHPHPLGRQAIKDRIKFWLSGFRDGRVVNLKKEGVQEVFYRNGEKIKENNYNDNKLLIREFDKESVVEKYRSYGNTRRYYEEDVYQNGQRIRHESYFKGNLTITPVENDEFNGLQESYLVSSGRPILFSTQEMKKGVPDGEFRQYYENGELMLSGRKKTTTDIKAESDPEKINHLKSLHWSRIRVLNPETNPLHVFERDHSYYVGWLDSFYQNGKIESRTFHDEKGNVRDVTSWDEAGNVVSGRHIDDKNVETCFLRDGNGFSAVISKNGHLYEVNLDEEGHRTEKEVQESSSPSPNSVISNSKPFKCNLKKESKLKNALFTMTPGPFKLKMARKLYGSHLKKLKDSQR